MKFLQLGFLTMLVSAALLATDADLRLIEAAKSGDVSGVRALLAQHVPTTAVDADGSTALHYAVRAGNIEVVDLLIANGADVKAATRYNITPLSLASGNADAAIIERILKAG